MSTITTTSLQTSYPPTLPKAFSSNQPQTIRLYPLSNYTFGTKENQPEEDPSVLARLKRLEEHYDQHGMRRTCEGILVCHEHNHPHILMLQIANAFFKLPGDYLQVSDDEIPGFKQRLNERLAPSGNQFTGNGVNDEWQIGDTLAQWWRPNFETFMYPFLPAHVTRPKECKKLYFIQLPKSKVLSVPKNMKLLAVPLFELYDNTARYGPQLSAIPHLLSRYRFEFVDEEGNINAMTPGGEYEAGTGGIKVVAGDNGSANGHANGVEGKDEMKMEVEENTKVEGEDSGVKADTDIHDNAIHLTSSLYATLPHRKTMLLLALTGSLATGKSTVSALLSQPPYNLPIIDADILAREVVEPGTPGYKKIVNHFASSTPDLLLPSPTERKGRPLNRAALGRRVFGSTHSRQRDRKILNSIVHPAVRYAMARSILYHYLCGYWAVVLDIPLLYDSRLDIFAPVVLMVAANSHVQMSRLRLRDPHLSEDEARNRVASQGGVDEKIARTEARGKGRGYVVWNNGSREELEAKIREVVREVERGRRGVWRWAFLVLMPLAGLWAGWEVGKGWWGRRQWEAEVKEKDE